MFLHQRLTFFSSGVRVLLAAGIFGRNGNRASVLKDAMSSFGDNEKYTKTLTITLHRGHTTQQALPHG